MPPESPIFNVTRVIQLSVAPVFLLTALGTLLGVFSTRLGRIVDRWRVLLERIRSAPPERVAEMEQELRLLRLRRKLVNSAITFAIAGALLVCVLIATAFVGSILHWDFSHPVAALFIAVMAIFICALLSFLTEVLVAVGNVRIEH